VVPVTYRQEREPALGLGMVLVHCFPPFWVVLLTRRMGMELALAPERGPVQVLVPLEAFAAAVVPLVEPLARMAVVREQSLVPVLVGRVV